MTKTEMDIRLTEKRAVCKQLKQFIREARAQELFALAGEASQMRWQLVAELQQARTVALEASHGHV